MPTSFVILDSRINGYTSLLANLAADTEYVVLDRERDGIVQITDALAGRSGYDS